MYRYITVHDTSENPFPKDPTVVRMIQLSEENKRKSHIKLCSDGPAQSFSNEEGKNVTFGNKYVDEEAETSQEQSPHQTTPPADFLQEEVGKDLHDKLHGCKDELCEVEVQPKPGDIQTYSIICEFDSKPTA